MSTDAPRGGAKPGPIVFVSTMKYDPWGGSEELWCATALRLAQAGYAAVAVVEGWLPLHPKLQALQDAGVRLILRPRTATVWQKGFNKLIGRTGSIPIRYMAEQLQAGPALGLIVHNDDFALPKFEYTEVYLANNWPFVTLCHANGEHFWPEGEDADRFKRGIDGAQAIYFVSNGNLKLAVKQSGFDGSRAEIVRNPFSVPYDPNFPWPSSGERLEMACVGRLDPTSKGQDVLIEALAHERWRGRDWRLNLYGEGRWRATIERLIRSAGLEQRILLQGHVAVEEIWRANHILVQPSRIEGLPITIVEAMLCARPVLTTDIAGNAEFLEEGVSGFIADAPVVRQIDAALERMWARRGDLRAMGEAARVAVRQHVPPDPVGVFMQRLIDQLNAARAR